LKCFWYQWQRSMSVFAPRVFQLPLHSRAQQYPHMRRIS
jgi:hypothetical protein